MRIAALHTTRHLKIYGKYVPGGGVYCPKTRIVPWLSLSGAWLGRAGFSVGDRVTVKTGRRKITITIDRPSG